MAASEEPDSPPKKRRRDSETPKSKLVVDQRIEVRSEEEGFLGSWHSGIVVACDRTCRHVRYDHLLTNDEAAHLVEAVRVSPALDGESGSRGNIRPLPPPAPVRRWDLHYGLCVDADYNDAWWEGVVFDHDDGASERLVLFPDLGDEMIMGIGEIRVTQDWDEATGEWTRRGSWVFLELIEEFEGNCGGVLPVSTRQIWYDVRLRSDFSKVGEWTRGERGLWEKMVSEVCDMYLKFFKEELCRRVLESSRGEPVSGGKLVDSCGALSDVLLAPVQPGKDWLASDASCDISVMNLSTGSNTSHPNEAPCGGVTQVLPVSQCNHNGVSCQGNVNKRPDRGKQIVNENAGKWQPVAAEMLSGTEFCPNAVDEYVRGAVSRYSVHKDLWGHLLYLGWKIEHSYENKIARKRYTPPDGGKCVYSLIDVCKNLKESTGDTMSSAFPGERRTVNASTSVALRVEKPRVSRNPDCFPQTTGMKPDYGSHPIVEYCRLEGQKVGRENLLELKSKATKQLLDDGWVIDQHRRRDGRIRSVYESPKGKKIHSLIGAFKFWCEMENPAKPVTKIRIKLGNKDISPSNTQSLAVFQESWVQPNTLSKMLSGEYPVDPREVKDKGIRKPRSKRNGNISEFSACLSHQRNGMLGSSEKDTKRKQSKISKTSNKLKDGQGGKSPTCVLRSSKCVKEVVIPNSSHTNPRSILSWLIDNNAVLPRAKVHYFNRREKRVMAEGRITRKGIACSCCSKLFALSSFALHAGCSRCNAAANIVLEDGRSILDCQRQVHSAMQSFATEPHDRTSSCWRQGENDYICSVCNYGGELMLCDQCPSSFHKSCLGLNVIPEGDWFCPSCCCRICGESKYRKETKQTRDGSILICSQCEHKYHVGCLRNRKLNKMKSNPLGYWFCNKVCKKIYCKLQKLLGKQTTLGAGNLTWSLLRSTKTDKCSTDSTEVDTVENYSKLSVALGVMHECFKPVKERRTRRDLSEDVIFSRQSDLQRLNFQGFYTVILARNDEMISVATVRVHGKKVAEVPLVGTRFQYRRLGMCRILMNELEKKLMEMGVERLVLPAVPSVLSTWTTSFGFSKMTPSERLQFLDYTFLDFQGTIMCQKLLTKIPSTDLSPLKGVQPCSDAFERGENGEIDRSSAVSEVYQAEETEDGQIASRGQSQISADHLADTKTNPTDIVVVVRQQQLAESRPCHGNATEETQDFALNLKKRTYTTNFFLQCYKRRKQVLLS